MHLYAYGRIHMPQEFPCRRFPGHTFHTAGPDPRYLSASTEWEPHGGEGVPMLADSPQVRARHPGLSCRISPLKTLGQQKPDPVGQQPQEISVLPVKCISSAKRHLDTADPSTKTTSVCSLSSSREFLHPSLQNRTHGWMCRPCLLSSPF